MYGNLWLQIASWHKNFVRRNGITWSFGFSMVMSSGAFWLINKRTFLEIAVLSKAAIFRRQQRVKEVVRLLYTFSLLEHLWLVALGLDHLFVIAYKCVAEDCRLDWRHQNAGWVLLLGADWPAGQSIEDWVLEVIFQFVLGWLRLVLDWRLFANRSSCDRVESMIFVERAVLVVHVIRLECC